jgi:hypothetical protein
MKKLISCIVIIFSSLNSFAAEQECVGIAFARQAHVEIDTLCADINNNLISNIYLMNSQAQNPDRTKVALGYRLKKEASDICNHFDLPGVSKREDIQFIQADEPGAQLNAKRGRRSFKFPRGRVFKKVICR